MQEEIKSRTKEIIEEFFDIKKEFPLSVDDFLLIRKQAIKELNHAIKDEKSQEITAHKLKENNCDKSKVVSETKQEKYLEDNTTSQKNTIEEIFKETKKTGVRDINKTEEKGHDPFFDVIKKIKD